MKARIFLLFAASAGLFGACTAGKKVRQPAGGTAATSPAAPRPSNGVFAPGDAELRAIRASNSAATLETLQEGYTLYTGTCTKCHGVKSIYSRPVTAWPGIIDDMAQKSRLSAAEKDAVLSYVLSVKATQEK